jgi:histidinol-phosphatase (PHP family)
VSDRRLAPDSRPVPSDYHRGPMLTDYHVHLRLDDLGETAAEHFTAANAERYRQIARERGIAELGVSEHVHRFHQALEVWRHPFWRENAVDDLDAYCAFVRAHTDLKLGVEADFVPGAEERMATLLEARDFDYVVGSVHFLGDRAVDMEDFDVWTGSGRSPEQIWRRYFQTLGEAARSGLFDILAHPDLVKVWGPAHPAHPASPVHPASAAHPTSSTDPASSARPGRPSRPGRPGRPLPEGDLRRYYELAIPGIAESQIAVEVSTAGLRKPVAELYPAVAFLEMCVEAGVPVALSSDAHRPEDVGADYGRALELLERVGVGELCVFERRRRRLEAIGADVRRADRSGRP